VPVDAIPAGVDTSALDMESLAVAKAEKEETEEKEAAEKAESSTPKK
jgi:hypothetical protein